MIMCEQLWNAWKKLWKTMTNIIKRVMKSYENHGNQWRGMKIIRHLWKRHEKLCNIYKMIYEKHCESVGNHWKHEKLWKSKKTNEPKWKAMKTHWKIWEAMKIKDKAMTLIQKVMKSYENHRTSTKQLYPHVPPYTPGKIWMNVYIYIYSYIYI